MDICKKQKRNIHKKQSDWTYEKYMVKMFYEHAIFWIKLQEFVAYVQSKKKPRTFFKKKMYISKKRE